MSIKIINKRRVKIYAAEKERNRLIKILLSDAKLIVGSLRDSLVRCGHEGCHCAKKPIHPVTRLSRLENGKLKNQVVRVADRVMVRKLSENYREHKKAISDLAKLNGEEIKLLKSVLKLKNVKYE